MEYPTSYNEEYHMALLTKQSFQGNGINGFEALALLTWTHPNLEEQQGKAFIAMLGSMAGISYNDALKMAKREKVTISIDNKHKITIPTKVKK